MYAGGGSRSARQAAEGPPPVRAAGLFSRQSLSGLLPTDLPTRPLDWAGPWACRVYSGGPVPEPV